MICIQELLKNNILYFKKDVGHNDPDYTKKPVVLKKKNSSQESKLMVKDA